MSKEVLRQCRDALETARNGLVWYRDRYPDAVDGSDDEASTEIDEAIAAADADLSAGAVLLTADDVAEAMRKRFVKLPRYSFLLDNNGNVRRVPDRCGNWVDFEQAHTLFDPVCVDAAIAARTPAPSQPAPATDTERIAGLLEARRHSARELARWRDIADAAVDRLVGAGLYQTHSEAAQAMERAANFDAAPPQQAAPVAPACESRCDGCGKTIREHDRMMRCQPAPVAPARPLREGEVMGAYMEFDRTADRAWSNVEYLTRFGLYISERTAAAPHPAPEPAKDNP